MCGIIGCISTSNNSPEIVLNGLKLLEYRGYDSWGIASISEGTINLSKKVGRIGDEKSTEKHANISIGHTRWATHGNVTEENAHPHLSNDGKIAVVHNGIVENYQPLKKMLLSKGFSFRSKTDTEIIPNIIQLFMQEGNDFPTAFRKTLLEIEGSYAIVAIHAASSDILGARKGSPLVIGISNEKKFFASDVPAFLEHTKKVIYLEDDEMAILSNETYSVFEVASHPKKMQKKTDIIAWDTEQAKKGEFEHFMLKEISEQSETVKKAIQQPIGIIEKATKMILNAKEVFFVGCGTSYHACVSSSYVFSHIAKMHVNVVLASEFRNYENFLTKDTLVVAVSQSGETADLIDAVKTAKKSSSKVLSIVNVMGSTLMRMSDESILMNAGPEICVLSTKSYTSQLAILLLLAYSTAGKTEEGKNLIESANSHIPELIKSNLSTLKVLAKKLHASKDIFLIGRDLAYPSALESALKIKEVSYIHAEAFAGGELKHGTIALIEENVPVIVFVTKKTRPLILSNAIETKSRGAFIIGIDSEENELYDFFINVPETGNADPILMVIPIQILAYYLALEKNLDPDKPRNLAKSVTVK
ncbi:MAG: glutamine--fructose-6-phosphate transaminase (isomerizing) [Candidatus Diapherotrites archaeon CG11_big_fil_rev_8_21_14_0_20_37_9]|nr:MAG: glutamine--fructose-6-phosphate transaminase (isomerizing) [Candidatus Diapherotrites archaeon CG11_big_fil_rev_8_21_14_0_20_37_9]